MGWLQNMIGEGTEDKEASELAKKAARMYDNISLPQYNIPEYARQEDLGTWDPALIGSQTIDAGQDVVYDPSNASLAGPSAMEDIGTDPRLADSQYASLGALDDIIKGGGLNAQDKAALNKIQTDVSAADRGRRDAILQNSAARGMGGGGNELLAQLTSGQAATDRQSQMGMDVAGLAQQRALDAIMQSGQLAGNMRGQEFGENSDIARAKDAINTFNAGLGTQNNQFNAGNVLQNAQNNRQTGVNVSTNQAGLNQQAGMYNAGATTDAAKYGKQNSQSVSNNNTAITNAQKDMPNQVAAQRFGDQTGLASLKSGATDTLAKSKQLEADRKTKTAGQMGSGALQVLEKYLKSGG